ncbi:ribose ABC transporter permease [Soehngenia longivitae]|uniref:Ribose ABC transporter permease n=1 Tax=Soehngenia longivitae TaxID=2562294 RepID=A0A4Z0D880_9FIRM|nr:ribose ABC transporter permease [Soehngenia longivitae]TFZ41097.1 ribose ABC transporter permease [Soehngenia longivitae]
MKAKLAKAKPFLGLVLIVIVVSILSPNFFTKDNLLTVLRQTSINAIIAAGMTFVILTAGIDLSVGSILGFSGAICAYLLTNGTNVILAFLAAVLVGAVFGLFNGVVITKGKVQPFIATLATMILLRGATMVFTNGKPIAVKGESATNTLRYIARGEILGIPVAVVMMIVVFIICYHILHNTKYGRHVYAVGGNEQAALLSGVNTDRVKMLAYMISGILASIAGIIVLSRLSSAQPTAGDGYELDAIAAVVLGGTSLAGGQGMILGTVVGAMIIGILNNALNLLDVQSYYQMIVRAIVILIAVLLDRKDKNK